ncbi:MAG: 6-bladed beta-propeller, partial [Actinobacteria bacterium]|nr:6-bladed beta-propeller [Actinomycetota bacterium]
MGGRKRILYISILVLLVAMLGGLVDIYLSLSKPAPEPAPVDISPGLQHIRSIYAYGQGPDKLLAQPFGIAFVDGKLYVGQMSKGNVIVMDGDGNYVQTIGVKGRGRGQLNSPSGLDVDNKGNVYVADPTHAKIVIFDKSGKPVQEIPIKYALVPRVFEDRRLYVAAFDSVKVLAIPGYQQLTSWGQRGRADAEFDFPNGLVVADGGDTVYVSDGNNMRLKKLDKNGEKIWIAGHPPKDMNDADRLFGLPSGMVLVGDVLYVTDPLNGSIHLFRAKDGTQIGQVGESGSGDGQFSYPSQIAWMGGNRFAVTEWGN